MPYANLRQRLNAAAKGRWPTAPPGSFPEIRLHPPLHRPEKEKAHYHI